MDIASKIDYFVERWRDGLCVATRIPWYLDSNIFLLNIVSRFNSSFGVYSYKNITF